MIPQAMVPTPRGRPGLTHCGSWLPVPPRDVYGWATRLVCAREPDHAGRHRSRNGWWQWTSGDYEPRPTALQRKETSRG